MTLDVIAFLIDATKPVGRGDEMVANHWSRRMPPLSF